MRHKVTSTLLFLALSFSGGCQEPINAPSDFNPVTLSVKEALQSADLVTLAYPISQRDVNGTYLFRRSGDREPPLRVIETETTLVVMKTLKGRLSLSSIRVRHYDGRGYSQIGPPQGPSGGIGSRGVFFLKGNATSSYRSLVDVYRPDIPTPWIADLQDGKLCEGPAACLAELLLTFHEHDKPSAFSAGLMTSAMTSRQLIGFLKTFKLLTNLTAGSYPEPVTQAACTQLSQMYALELPSKCLSLFAGTPLEKEYLEHVSLLRSKLKSGGLSWLQDRIQSSDHRDVISYLEILKQSGHEETRRMAETLINSVGPAHDNH
jgi:hypothetical protein